MTCSIMAVRDNKLYLATDACLTTGWEKSSIPAKIRKIGGFHTVIAGAMPVIQMLENFGLPDSQHVGDYYMQSVYIPAMRDFIKGQGYWNSDKCMTVHALDLLSYIKGEIYLIDSYLTRTKIDNFWAIGNGSPTALAIIDTLWDSGMSMKEILMTSLEAAAKYNVGVEAPFYIQEIELTQETELKNVKSKKKRRNSS